MKLNSTVALTFVLLILMVAAGAVSGLWGYAMGYEALKGVTQPDTSPSRKLIGDKQATMDRKELKILLKEQDILKDVKESIRRGNESIRQGKNPSELQKEQEASAESENAEGESKKAANLPVTAREQDVALTVTSATEDGGSLVLDVKLQNESSQSLRFLYSFLEVKDEQGRILSAITDGLPGELPARSQEYSGTVKVPTALLDGVEKVSLSLTDYPDRKLQLSLADIPVKD